jgi:beta-galactosidase
MSVPQRSGWVALWLTIALLLPGSGFAAAALSPAASDTRQVLELMHNWRFVQDDKLTDQAALKSSGADWQAVNLPHTWNADDAATLNATRPYKRGIGWYRLEFDTPAAGARHWLEFGAASMVADVWLNGRKLGQHRGGFQLFRFDVTDSLARSGRNVLLVKVDNRYPTNPQDPTAILPITGDFNFSGGLYRHVALVSTGNAVHIDLGDLGGPGVYARTTAIDAGTARLKVRTRLRNDGAESGSYTVRVKMVDAGGRAAASAESRSSVAPGRVVEVERDLEVRGARLWQGRQDPYLYTLVSEVVGPQDQVLDRVVQEFGIRQVRFDPNRGTFINGKPVRLHGVAIHQDYLGKGWAMTRQEMEESMALVKEIGANVLRLGHYPFDPYVLQLADRIGLVVWSEVPFGITSVVVPPLTSPKAETACPQDNPTEDQVANIGDQLREQVRQQYNHASIAVWGVGNEVTFYQGQCKIAPWHDNFSVLLRRLHTLAQQEDPGRATTLATHTDEAEEPTAGGYISVGGITDVWALNKYYLWYSGPVTDLGTHLDTLRKRFPDQPLGMSEYGAGGALTHHTDNVLGGPPKVREVPGVPVTYQPEEYAAWVHEQNYAMLRSKPYLWGTFVWNLFDFGSGLRNEGDTRGVNTKGLVSFDRKSRKDAFYFYKANWSEEPVTYVASRRYTERAYPVTDVKVYSNAQTVRLTVNGRDAGALRQQDCLQAVCVFRKVRLAPGDNTLVATGDHGGKSVADTVKWSLKSEGIHIAAGQLTTGFSGADGTRFGSDNFFIGGVGQGLISTDSDAVPDPTPVTGTDAPDLYRGFRYGRFSYDIPLDDGNYQVTLGFLEPLASTQIGHRVFDVLVDGVPRLSKFDVLEAAGGKQRRVVTRSFPVTVKGGQLRLDFEPRLADAVVSSVSVRKQ